jgi:competence protein ComEA
MNASKSHFVFTKKQRNGILLLVLCIIVAQLVYLFVDFPAEKSVLDLESEEIVNLQNQIDSLKQVALEDQQPKIYPFNPNYITDYRGYTLGMSTEEIDRLHQFRAQNKWVNSAEEFQQVTKVSDSMLAAIEPYFQFPEWVTNPKTTTSNYKNREKTFAQKKDLNTATAEELQEIRGIGEVLSKRIITYRDKLGGFLIDEQLQDIYGLEYGVIRNILHEFTVKNTPEIEKININTASASDMATLPFISFELAKEIVNYRLLHEGIKDFGELKAVAGFPVQKIDRITLYLSLE